MAVEYVKDKLATIADPALLATLFAEAPVAFAVAHADGRLLVVNRAYRELFGAAPPPGRELLDELARAHDLAPFLARAFAGEAVVVPAFWHDAGKHEHLVDPRRVALELSITPLPDRDGTTDHIALCFRDVTAAHELASERSLLRTLFGAAPEAVVTSDLRTGRLDDANDNAVRLFGHARPALLELGLADLCPQRQLDGRRSADLFAEHVDRAMAGEPVKLEWMHRTAGGDDIPCEVQLVRVPAGGRSLCRISIVDLRERKHLDSERERVRQLEEQTLRT